MFVEFFCSCKSAPVAWVGATVFVTYSFYLAWFKAQLNRWYGDFYDLVSVAGEVSSGNSTDTHAQAVSELHELVWLVGPMTVVSPSVRYLRSRYAFAWRMRLVKSYLQHVWPISRTVEGSSQRVQEDTARFAIGLSGAASLFLDTVLSLFVFVPVLMELGGDIEPPGFLHFCGSSWLLFVAFGSAIIGLIGSVLTGYPLIALEVKNQVVEASFRKQLVLDETGNASSSVPVVTAMLPNLHALDHNYRRLYAASFRLSIWLSSVDQIATLLPFLILTPRLFEDSPDRVLLGQLVRCSDAFGKVFGSLSVLSEHYSHFTEWISVIRRLRQFERQAMLKNGLPRERSVELTEEDGTSGET